MKLAEYRVETAFLTFNVFGQLQQAQGVHILRLRATVNQAVAVEQDVANNRAVTVFAIAEGELVLPARVHKVKARPEGRDLVDLACMVLA